MKSYCDCKRLIKIEKLILIFLFLLMSSSFAWSKEFKVMYTHTYPLNYSTNNQRAGISFDVLNYLMKNTNHNVSDFLFVPWARLYHEGLTNDDIILVGMADMGDRREFFHMIGPIFSDNIALIGLKTKAFNINDIHTYSFAAIRNAAPLKLLNNSFRIVEEKQYPVSRGSQMVQMLSSGRVDFIVHPYHTFRKDLLDEGLDPDHYELKHDLKKVGFYLAINKKNKKVIAENFQKAFEDYVDKGLHRQSLMIHLR